MNGPGPHHGEDSLRRPYNGHGHGDVILGKRNGMVQAPRQPSYRVTRGHHQKCRPGSTHDCHRRRYKRSPQPNRRVIAKARNAGKSNKRFKPKTTLRRGQPSRKNRKPGKKTPGYHECRGSTNDCHRRRYKRAPARPHKRPAAKRRQATKSNKRFNPKTNSNKVKKSHKNRHLGRKPGNLQKVINNRKKNKRARVKHRQTGQHRNGTDAGNHHHHEHKPAAYQKNPYLKRVTREANHGRGPRRPAAGQAQVPRHRGNVQGGPRRHLRSKSSQPVHVHLGRLHKFAQSFKRL